MEGNEMIFTLMIVGLIALVQLIFGVLPNAPATPQSVIDGGAWITDQIGSVIAVLNYVFGATLLAAIMVVVIAMFTWEYIYAASMWIIRKIPMINIK
jgi:hypothetical protein